MPHHAFSLRPVCSCAMPCSFWTDVVFWPNSDWTTWTAPVWSHRPIHYVPRPLVCFTLSSIWKYQSLLPTLSPLYLRLWSADSACNFLSDACGSVIGDKNTVAWIPRHAGWDRGVNHCSITYCTMDAHCRTKNEKQYDYRSASGTSRGVSFDYCTYDISIFKYCIAQAIKYLLV